jgi:hypothetical protein
MELEYIPGESYQSLTQVLTAVIMKSSVFWDITMCCPFNWLHDLIFQEMELLNEMWHEIKICIYIFFFLYSVW